MLPEKWIPDWFDDWNAKNPVNWTGPATWVGIGAGAVFVTAMVVTFGSPTPVESLQTGPRGTGMSVTKFVDDLETPDPDIAGYYTEQAYPPEEGEDLARDVYENVQVLGDVTVTNFNRLMAAMTQWVSPEQGCGYCHANADQGQFAGDELYTKHVSRRMIQMTQWLNEEWPAHLQSQEVVGVNCYTCHRGQNVPSDIWFRIAPVTEASSGWAAVQNQVTMQSQYTSLPSDALEKYLLEDNPINVHNLESRVAETPSDPGVATWQDTERTFSLMNYFSNSLNRNCLFCHNSRAFYAASGQVTPQWSLSMLGIDMVQEMNNEYLVPLEDRYPPHRLGPVYADAPKAACRTCHKGYQRPLQGLDMITDWPELVTTGVPVYE